MRGEIIVLAKAPRPGIAKTRLCPPLTPHDAARLATAFLRDTVRLLQCVPGVDVVVAVTPASGGLRLQELPPWAEVDTVEDLRRLRDRLRHAGAGVAPATRHAMGELALIE